MNKEINKNQQLYDEDEWFYQYSNYEYDKRFEKIDSNEMKYMLNIIQILMNNLMNFVDIEWIKCFIRGYEDYEDYWTSRPGPKMVILFSNSIGETRNLCCNYGMTIDQLLRNYLYEVGKSFDIRYKVGFLFNTNKLNFGDKTPI